MGNQSASETVTPDMAGGSMRFDLFKLHDKEIDNRPEKWICAKKEEVTEEVTELIERITKTSNISKWELAKSMAKDLNISLVTSGRLVSQRKDWLPLIFIEKLLKLSGKAEDKEKIIENIKFLKVSQPPLKIVKAPKALTLNLCKIAGAHAADGTLAYNFFCITDGQKSNLTAFGKWLKEEFGLDYEIISKGKNEWGIRFHNKIFARYLNKFFGFPSGYKCQTVREPPMIKNSGKEYRKAFASGALMFEAGLGVKHQIELCVLSKNFMMDISEILKQNKIKHVKMDIPSGGYWRLWSKQLTKQEANDWLQMFEPQTEKWHKLSEYITGYKGKVNSFDEALAIFDKIYPKTNGSKVSITDILKIMRSTGRAHRYKIADLLKNENNLESYGGKWGHSLRHYLDILKAAKIITVEKRKFGLKKSFGSIIREEYIYNPHIQQWLVPKREA